MPQLGAHGRHHRLLPVVSAVALNASELADPRLTAVGAYQQAGLQAGSAKLQRHPIRSDLNVLQPLGAEQSERVQRGHARIQATLDNRVLDDVAQGVDADVGAVEMQAAATGGIPHMHFAEYPGALEG